MLISWLDSLKIKLTKFLRNNYINFYGVSGPERGSKICRVYIKHKDVDRIKQLNGGTWYGHQFWFMQKMEFEDSVLFVVNCKKIW